MIDGTWREWLHENLERGCDPADLTRIMRQKGFSASSVNQTIASIRQATGGVYSANAGAPPAASWQNWLRENLERGCDRQELRQILAKNGFGEQSIDEMMSLHPVGEGLTCEPDYEALADVPLSRNPPPGLRAFAPERLQLYTIDDFLSEAECDRICELTNRQLRPSTTTTEGDYAYRTSRTCDLATFDDQAVAWVDLKIAKTLGIRPEYSEAIQAQRYEVGQEFKKHTDYFEPGTDEYARFAGERGNRTWTFMVYLNEGMQGGATRFFAADYSFQPRKGQAVIWNNLYRDGRPNPDTLHAGEPVTAGHKLIITKWFLETGSGPMFFGDSDL